MNKSIPNMKETNIGSLIKAASVRKGLDHFDQVNLDQINSGVMEEWSSMRDNEVLDGDALSECSDIFGWGLGFASSYSI